MLEIVTRYWQNSIIFLAVIFIASQEQVIYKFLATRIYKFIGWGAGGRHFKEVGLVNLGVSSGELSFSKSYMVDKRGHHGRLA